MPTERPPQVFLCYARGDGVWRDRLETVLAPLVRHDVLEFWSDEKIQPGDRWFEEIEKALSRAAVAVFLVTPEFLASEFIQRKELPALLRAREERGLKLLWVPVKPCLWEESPLAGYQAVCAPQTPLSSLPEAEAGAALVEVARAIRDACHAVAGRGDPAGRWEPPPGPVPVSGPRVRRRRRTAAFGATLVAILALLWGSWTGWTSTWQVRQTDSSVWRLNRGNPPADAWCLEDGQGRPVGLAWVADGIWRPRVRVDIPDPAARGRRAYRATPMDPLSDVPRELGRAGEVVESPGGEAVEARLNLGRRHGVWKGDVYRRDSPEEIPTLARVVQVEEDGSILEPCGSWAAGDRAVRVETPGKLLEKLENRVHGALDGADLKAAEDVLAPMACLPGSADVVTTLKKAIEARKPGPTVSPPGLSPSADQNPLFGKGAPGATNIYVNASGNQARDNSHQTNIGIQINGSGATSTANRGQKE